MQSLATIRQWHIEQLENAIATYEYILLSAHGDLYNRLRDGGDGWTVKQVVGHLRDFESVFIIRATMTLEEDNPELPFPNPDDLAASQNDNAQPMKTLIKAWREYREQYLGILKGISDESAWERPAQHPTRGNFTLHDQLFLAVWHDMNHLKQISNILMLRGSNS